MSSCLGDESLVAVSAGEGTSAERAHVRACRHCAARGAALDDDLRLLREALLEGPLPAPSRTARWGWVPMAGALAATAALALVWAAPWSPMPRPPASETPLSSLASDVSFALFDSSQHPVVAQVSDTADLQAALGGGWPCDEAGLYGVDCGAVESAALYTE